MVSSLHPRSAGDVNIACCMVEFEWAWHQPLKLIAIREAAAGVPSSESVPGMIRLVCTMLNLSEWQSLNLTVQFITSAYLRSCSIDRGLQCSHPDETVFCCTGMDFLAKTPMMKGKKKLEIRTQ